MSTNPFADIQALIENYVTKVNGKGIQMGVAIGVVTPDYPSGQILCSTRQILNQAFSEMNVTDTTPFEIGSVSKVFTVGIYNQAQSGNFSPTLGSLLGSNMSMSDAVKAITLQELAAYSSGLPQDNGMCPLHPDPAYPPGTTATLQSLFKYLSTYDTLAYQPGGTYSYSNLGFSLAAMAAVKLDSLDDGDFETAYNNALIQYCRLFDVDQPGWTVTTLVYGQADAQTLPVGYNKSYQQAIAPPCTIPEYGAGGIVSTPSDMLRFLIYCMGSGYASLQVPVWTLPDYCINGTQTETTLGWFVDATQIDNQTIVSKDGGVAGFTAWIAMTQKPSGGSSSCGLFVLTNGPDAVWLGRQAFALLLSAAAAPEIPERSFDARVR